MLVPVMLSLEEAMEQSAYSEEELFDWGISGQLKFLVVVPEIGACRVPDVALSHFMAGADSFDADQMPEHWSGRLSGRWTIARERLRIYEDDWHRLSAMGQSLVEASDSGQVDMPAPDADAHTATEDQTTTRHRFVTSARPKEIPAELLALPDHARVWYEHSIGRQRGSGDINARDYRASVMATIAIQAEGYFTINEAAQILADSRPGVDATEAVKRFHTAHSKGELPVHDGQSRFRKEPDELVRDFFDLLQLDELDRWLRSSTGYGFPKADEQSAPPEATVPVAAVPAGGQASSKAIGSVPASVPWKLRAQNEAYAEWLRQRANGGNPTRQSVRGNVRKWCVENNVVTSTGVNPSDGYLRTHVLSERHWTTPQTMTPEQAKRFLSGPAQAAQAAQG